MIKTKRFSGLYSIWGWAVFLSAGLFFCAVCPAFELSDEETGQADEAALAQEQPGGFEQVLNTGEDKRLSLDYKDADLNSVLK
ncbi:MAG: hypothetical protein PHR91_06705, partial [Candidatus Omnitrophica bacterium]|nr:hypothetical protein [Candidatus Omnitrophota bacterium]